MSDTPRWWNTKSGKLELRHLSGPDATVLIDSATACLTIRPSRLRDGWVVGWEINYDTENFDRGARWFTSDELRTAFGLGFICSIGGCEIANTHYVDCAEPDKFIRQDNYLCIPGPPDTLTPSGIWLAVKLDSLMKSSIECLLTIRPQGGAPIPASL